MLLTKDQREEFAKTIVNAANLAGSFEGGKFIENMRYTENIKMTGAGTKKIEDWIRYSNGALGSTRNEIKHNYPNPKAVYDFLVKSVNPPLD